MGSQQVPQPVLTAGGGTIPAFCKIKDVPRYTSLSQYAIRRGCVDGSIPCVKWGKIYYVNMAELFRIMNEKTKGGGTGIMNEG